MWSENKNIEQGLEQLIKENMHPDVKCCNNPQIHTFIHKFGKTGSGWIWCSSCKSFSHSGNVRLPFGWENCKLINEDMICVEPDYLEANKQIIDEHMKNW